MAKKAVCIGINEYPAPLSDLRGCLNDADDWANLLDAEFRFDAINQLKDGQATCAGMTGALRDLVTGAEAGDVLVFTYSGHGTWVPDRDGDEEADNRDEALCAYDGLIVDDEIREILAKLTPGARLTVISDSCHSGSVTRATVQRSAEVRTRNATPDTSPIPRFSPPEDAMVALQATRLPVRGRMFYPESGMAELLITGCNALEYSYDAYIDGRYNGAMTANALRVIREEPGMTYAEFHRRLRKLLPTLTYKQSPQLEGRAGMKNRPLFT